MNGFRREIQHSAPLPVGDREVVIEAEVWSFQAKQLTISDHNVSGGGALWTWARPRAVLERSGETTYRTPISDINLRLEMALLIAAIVLPVLLTIFTTWARRTTAPRD